MKKLVVWNNNPKIVKELKTDVELNILLQELQQCSFIVDTKNDILTITTEYYSFIEDYILNDLALYKDIIAKIKELQKFIGINDIDYITDLINHSIKFSE